MQLRLYSNNKLLFWLNKYLYYNHIKKNLQIQIGIALSCLYCKNETLVDANLIIKQISSVFKRNENTAQKYIPKPVRIKLCNFFFLKSKISVY